jgi:hypothetical protein
MISGWRVAAVLDGLVAEAEKSGDYERAVIIGDVAQELDNKLEIYDFGDDLDDAARDAINIANGDSYAVD